LSSRKYRQKTVERFKEMVETLVFRHRVALHSGFCSRPSGRGSDIAAL
jgi:hypothetical protein